jgi:hypothetical protein
MEQTNEAVIRAQGIVLGPLSQNRERTEALLFRSLEFVHDALVLT